MNRASKVALVILAALWVLAMLLDIPVVSL